DQAGDLVVGLDELGGEAVALGLEVSEHAGLHLHALLGLGERGGGLVAVLGGLGAEGGELGLGLLELLLRDLEAGLDALLALERGLLVAQGGLDGLARRQDLLLGGEHLVLELADLGLELALVLLGVEDRALARL